MSPARRPWSGLALAAFAALALPMTLAFAPGAPWRLPVALAGGLWAPGYALLAACHPLSREGLGGLERHALGFALGLLAAPLVGLFASLAGGFEATSVASVLALLTLAGVGVALARAGSEAAPFVHGRPPGTLATAAVCVGTLVLVALLGSLPTPGAGHGTPLSLALTGPDGSAASIPSALATGGDGLVLVTLEAGERPGEGTLRVTWSKEGSEPRALLDERLVLAPGGVERRELSLPTDEPGTFTLVARWEGAQPREVHARVQVREAGA